MQPVTLSLAEHFGTPDRRRIAAELESVLRAAALQEPKRRRLFSLIDEGDCDDYLADRIAGALGEPAGTEFRRALERSGTRSGDLSALLADGAPDDPRQASEPHLWILHERTLPQPLFPVALAGLNRWKVLDLPSDIEHRAREQRHRIIRQRVLDHRTETGGRPGLFGHVTGYLYCPDPEHSYKVTTGGRIDSLNRGPFGEFIPRIGMGKR